MISRRYKILFDVANCIMIYLLALSVSLGITALVRAESFSWPYTIVSAVVLVIFVAVRLYVQQLPISLVAHGVVCVICYYLPFGNTANGKNWLHTLMIVGFAALLAVIDINDFYKKKNQSYGIMPVAACAIFLPVYAYVAYAANKVTTEGNPILGNKYDLFATIVCILCIAFFAFSLIRAYVSNAIKLADNSQIDENAPVNYMYGNSNKFIGPIIALIIAIMLVIQSKTSANILAKMWMGLLSGVAGVCNLFSFLNSDNTDISANTGIAATGSTLYAIEVIISVIILAAIIIAIMIIISKMYKSHWHKDISSDETLESAAMVEKREWIYHKESKKTAEDTSVTKAAEIPTPQEAAEAEESKEEEVKEEAAEEKAE